MIESFLSKRNVRDYLNQFPETQWKSVIINTLDIGIESLKRNHNIISLTLDDLKQLAKLYKDHLYEIPQTTNSPSLDRAKAGKLINIQSKPSSEWRTGNSSSKSKHSNQSNDQGPLYNYSHDLPSNYIPSNVNHNSNVVDYDDHGYQYNPYKRHPYHSHNTNYPNNHFDHVKNFNHIDNFGMPIENNKTGVIDSSAYHSNINNVNNPYLNNPDNNTNNKTCGRPLFTTGNNVDRTRNKTPQPTITRNNRFTNSLGMQNAIYPDWWGANQDDDLNNFSNENEDDKEPLPVTKIANKHFSEKLSLRERQAILDRSRRDCPSGGGSGSGNNYSRGRSNPNINTRDRIYDRPEPIEVSYNNII